MRMSLEDIFLHLTTEDTTEDAAEAAAAPLATEDAHA